MAQEPPIQDRASYPVIVGDLIATDYYSSEDYVQLYRIVEFCGTKPVEQTIPIYIDEDVDLIGYYDYEYIDQVRLTPVPERKNLLHLGAETIAKEWGGVMDVVDDDVCLIRLSDDKTW